VSVVGATDTTIYIGGNFHRVGPATGGVLPPSSVTGQPLGMPRGVGQVMAVVPDSSCGCHLGAEFTHVGGVPRFRLARLRVGHPLSLRTPGADGAVRAIAVKPAGGGRSRRVLRSALRGPAGDRAEDCGFARRSLAFAE
jgi:hypothetical protein